MKKSFKLILKEIWGVYLDYIIVIYNFNIYIILFILNKFAEYYTKINDLKTLLTIK